MTTTESKTPLDLGRSVSVPNVQELAVAISAANGSGEIPERYIRPEAESDPVISPSAGFNLPVIDMNKLLDPASLDEQELAKLGFACREWGFFQIINHEVPVEVVNMVKDDVMGFFKLPLKERDAIKQSPGNVEGYGQLFVQSEDQKLDWADMLVLVTRPSARRNMKFWPSNPPAFRFQPLEKLLGIRFKNTRQK